MLSSFDFEDRPSDSPYIERIWRNESDSAIPFTSLAVSQWQMVVTKLQGETFLTIRGPETKATPAYCPADAEFFGIFFKYGAFMPHLPTEKLVDSSVTLPDAGDNSFWLNGSSWEFPSYDNADTFVERLMREGLLVRDTVVEDAIQGHLPDLSLRSVQRRFTYATGLTRGSIRQIERARQAAILLKQGVPLLDTVYETGYADQPHLTRSLKHLIGYTPGQIHRENETEHVGFLFKPSDFIGG